MFSRRINIFTGHFGSGKTEVAVNYCLQMSEIHKKTSIIDFDIVNPYFRTTDAKDILEEKGIWVITPRYANTNVDVPAIPAEVNTLIEQKEYNVVFDVGGDDLGARALSRYRSEIAEEEYEMFFVINTKRPMTDTADKIYGMVKSIEESSRLKVTKLVNNTNLLGYTAPEDIIEGQNIINAVSEELGIPTGFASIMRSAFTGKDNVGFSFPLLLMDKLIRLPWEKNET